MARDGFASRASCASIVMAVGGAVVIVSLLLLSPMHYHSAVFVVVSSKQVPFRIISNKVFIWEEGKKKLTNNPRHVKRHVLGLLLSIGRWWWVGESLTWRLQVVQHWSCKQKENQHHVIRSLNELRNKFNFFCSVTTSLTITTFLTMNHHHDDDHNDGLPCHSVSLFFFASYFVAILLLGLTYDIIGKKRQWRPNDG